MIELEICNVCLFLSAYRIFSSWEKNGTDRVNLRALDFTKVFFRGCKLTEV